MKERPKSVHASRARVEEDDELNFDDDADVFTPDLGMLMEFGLSDDTTPEAVPNTQPN